MATTPKECTAESHAAFMCEYSKLRIQRMYDLRDPDYVWYKPEIDPTADAYTVLVPMQPNVMMTNNIVSLYVPDYLDSIKVCGNIPGGRHGIRKYITININKEPDPPIESILSQTRSLPNFTVTNIGIHGYTRIVLGYPFIKSYGQYDYLSLFRDVNYVFYVEEIYFCKSKIPYNPIIHTCIFPDEIMYLSKSQHFNCIIFSKYACEIDYDKRCPTIADYEYLWIDMGSRNGIFTLTEKIWHHCQEN